MLKKLLFVLTGKEKKRLVSLALGSMILAISETISIGLIIPIMSLFLSNETTQGSTTVSHLQNMVGLHDRVAFLTFLICVTMAIFLFKSVYSVFMLRFQHSFSGSIYCRLTDSIISSYLYRPYSFHLDNNSSVLFKNMITEVGQFTSGFLSPAILMVSEAMVLTAILTLLICVYPSMTMILVVIFSVITVTIHYFMNRKIKSYSRDREVYSAAIYVTANEALGGIKEIQVNGAQGYFIERFSIATKKHQDSYLKFSILSSLPRYFLETIIFFTMLTVLLVSLHLRRPAAELIPMMTVMGAASIKLLPSANKIYLNFNSLHYYTNSLNIVYTILKDARQSGVNLAKTAHNIGGIDKSRTSAFRVEKLRFSYKDNSKAVIDGLNADIPFSRTCAIVGASGAGKTTFIDLLAGLLTPLAGAIYYRDMRVYPHNICEIRKKIGYVPQQIFLIDNTIGANIMFGINSDQHDRVLLDSAIKMANLESFIKTLPEGIDTLVGERGVRLSGGQRQRIGIARALYRNPEVLILDEATSALDGKSEAEVIDAIKKMKDAGMAVVIVAHRLSTISSADLIFVMDHGKIAAQGSFKDLHDNSDIFNSIVHKIADSRKG